MTEDRLESVADAATPRQVDARSVVEAKQIGHLLPDLPVRPQQTSRSHNSEIGRPHDPPRPTVNLLLDVLTRPRGKRQFVVSRPLQHSY